MAGLHVNGSWVVPDHSVYLLTEADSLDLSPELGRGATSNKNLYLSNVSFYLRQEKLQAVVNHAH